MTAQDHIDAIGRALAKSEEAVKAMRKALRLVEDEEAAEALRKLLKLVEEHHAILHARLDRAQKAYMATRDGKNIVAFSGGTDKPPVTDPDKPVKP